MQGTQQTTGRSAWLQDCNSMLISALCNLVVLVALGLMTGAMSNEWGGVKLLINASEGESALLDVAPIEESVKIESAEDPAAALGPVTMFDDVAVATADIAALDALSENSATASGLEGLALGGTGQDDGAIGQSAAEFFGVGGYGQTFVYVVDASDSMNENGKFDRARYELLKSIEQLASDQKFYVIFYNDAAYPMDADRPVLATEAEISKTANWVNGAIAQSGTNPLPALLHALSLRPDAIFFLSDGQFDPQAINVLRARNRPSRRIKMRQIPIHTIAFVDYATVGLMRSIARNSGGEHRFVQ
jgi:hypothetical protein